MGRKATEKRKKGSTTASEMKRAVDLHVNSKMSIRKAAKECQVAYPTLRRYVQNFKQNEAARMEPNYTVNMIFTTEQELHLKEYVIDCADKFYGLSSKETRKVAYQMGKYNDIEVPQTWHDNKMAGKDWLRGFKARHPELKVKKPEACSLARATAFNETNIKKFFDNLKAVSSRNPQFGDGSRIYNLDETSTTTVQKPPKVLAPKGRSVCKVTSGERGVLVTTCCIVSAHGQALPPAMVFPRKNFKETMLYGAPPGTLGLASQSGWMNADLFIDVMRHFIKHTSASKENPALLIMDNHESHLSIKALDLAKDNGVTVLTLHPHTTAKMQPLDVGLLAPFKTFYNAAVDSWLMRNPGKTLTIHNVAECVGPAYLKSMTPINIVHAFKKCGIFPFDDQIFTEIDFLPSSVTDRPAVESDDETDAEENSRMSPSLLNDRGSSVDVEPSTKASLEVAAEPTTSKTTTTMIESLGAAIPSLPSTSCPNQKHFISPKVFRQPIKAGLRKNRQHRKHGKSIIATDTPEKDALAQLKAKKNIKKQGVKRVKQNLFKKNIKRIKKIVEPTVESDTSNDEDENFKASGSSSGGEQFMSDFDEEEEETVLNDVFPPLLREPCGNDFVIVHFKSKNDNVYYVAKILEILDDDEELDFYVSYLKLKSKVQQRFIEPVIPDTAGVKRLDVKYILPAPKIEGTSRRQATYKFPVDMSLLSLRF